jgi:N-carbamoylputrescine amidase
VDQEEIVITECDLGLVEEFRRIWPFFRDRRIDTYAPLAKRYLDE